jgi:ABC-type polysaccharide/polyol phosphate export permease
MGILQSLNACYAYRALIHNLTVRQLSARYRGSALGFLWTFLNPLLLVLVYSLVFTVYVRFEMESYTAFVFCGLVPWLWFTNSLSEGANAIVGSGNLITKAMFPPEVLPVVSVLANLCNFLMTLPILFVVILVSGKPLGAALVALPVVVIVQSLVTLGLVMFLAALNVQFRDVQHLLANILTFWFFLCPILYPHTNVPERLQFLNTLNFMSALTISYQDILFHDRLPAWEPLAFAAAVGIVVLFAGDWLFRRNRETFAEWL